MKNFNKILFGCLFLCASIIPFLGESSNNKSNQTTSWTTTDGPASYPNLVKMENTSLKSFFSTYYLDNKVIVLDYTSYEANIPTMTSPGHMISKGFDQTLNPNGDIVHNGFLTWMPSSWSWQKYCNIIIAGTNWGNNIALNLKGYQPTLLQPKIVLEGITTTSSANSQNVNYDFHWGIHWGIQVFDTALLDGSFNKIPGWFAPSFNYRVWGHWSLMLKQENIVSHMTYNQVTQNISNSGLQASYAGMTQINDSWSDQKWTTTDFLHNDPADVYFNAPTSNLMSQHKFQPYYGDNNIPRTTVPNPLIQTTNIYFGDTPWYTYEFRLLNYMKASFNYIEKKNTDSNFAKDSDTWLKWEADNKVIINDELSNINLKSVDAYKDLGDLGNGPNAITVLINFTYATKKDPNQLIESSIKLAVDKTIFDVDYQYYDTASCH